MVVETDRRTIGVPWYRRAGVWIGIGTGPGALTVGGGLAARLPLPTLLLAMLFGAVALTSLAVAEGVASRRRREFLARRAASTFGPGSGAGLLNLVIALGMMGWFSFYVGMAGFSLANLLNLPGWIGALAVATALFTLSELGLDRWNLLVWITTTSALGAAIVALIVVGEKPSVVAATSINLYELLWGAGSVVAYAIVFATRAGDFTWDLEADSDVYKAGVALLVPLLIFLGIGAILYSAVGDWNLADILGRTKSAALGHLFLMLSIVGPALSGFHSGALALESLVSLTKRQSAGLICAVGFVLGAARFDRQVLLFLDLVGAVIPPALVVMLVTAILSRKPTSAAALAAWVAGAAVAILLKLQGQLSHMIIGAAVSIIVLQGMMLLSDQLHMADAQPGQDVQRVKRKE